MKINYKSRKRILRVIEAIKHIEMFTTEVAALLAHLSHLPEQQLSDDGRPGKKKTKAEIFRENWLEKDQVIKLIRISERSLYTLRKEGKLPSYTIKRRIFFKLSDVEKLLEKEEH